MKKSLILCLAAAIAALGSSCTQTPLEKLTISGNSFVTESGDSVVLRGLALADPWKVAPQGHWNNELFEKAAEWGANVVRIPVHPLGINETGWDKYFEYLDDGIRMAGENKLYVIIDWHSIGNLRSGLYGGEAYETSWEETVRFWKMAAERYKGNPAVVGYELFNEPTTGDFGELGECTWHEWKCLMETLIDEVRAVDPDAICMVAGLDWAFDLYFAGGDPVLRDQVAYINHPYPSKAAHPWPENWEGMFGYLADTYPVVCTEIGFEPVATWGNVGPCGTDEPYGEMITEYFEQRGISFTAWCFDPDWGPALITGWDYTPSISGEVFKAYLQGQKK